MAIQQFKEFYREKGILSPAALTDPTPVLIKKLPMGSVLHYLGDEDVRGLDSSDPLMKGYSEQVAFLNVTSYDPSHSVGSERSPAISTAMAKFKLHNRNFKEIKQLKDFKTVTKSQLAVLDYSWQDDFHKSVATRIGVFEQLEAKLWSIPFMVKKINDIDPRHHFIVIPTPVSLVAKSQLDSKATANQPQLSSTFYGFDEQFLRHIWMALDPSKSKLSIFGDLKEQVSIKDEDGKEIPVKNRKVGRNDARYINFLYKTYDGKYAVLNLGYLLSFVNGNENLTLTSNVASRNYVDIQKYYLASMMGLQTINASGASAAAQEQAEKEKAEQIEMINQAEEEGSEIDQRFLQEISTNTVPPEIGSGENSGKAGDDERRVLGAPSEDPLSEINADKREQEINADIAALEEITRRKTAMLSHAKKGSIDLSSGKVISDTEVSTYTSVIPEDKEIIQNEFFRSRTPKEALIEKLNKYADDGSISSAEFRRKKQLIEEAGNIPDPYGSGKTITEASIVTKKDLAIDPEDAKMVVPDAVIDKSMAESSLRVLGPKYNTEVLYKDILACVQYAQRGGVIIRNHTVDTQRTILGDYDIHTLEIVPLKGQPSLLRARIPRPNEEGYYTAKSTKYTMRPQRTDDPIRKIGPNRVALSSDYGKAFVDRATKKANSSLAFVLSRLSKATIQPDEHLRDVSPGNVFDNYFEAPYIYNGISEQYQSFKAGIYDLDFNPKGMRSKLPPAVVEQIEKNGTRIVGRVSGRSVALVVVDKNNIFHTVQADGGGKIGDIYDLLKMDRTAAPIDFAEVKVFSKYIPVGIFLAKTMGFRKLVKFLGAKHRIVEGREKKNLEQHEYVVQFKDFAYVFDSRESINTLILAGFIAFEKETKLFTAETYDAPDVYLRLLESKGLNVAYFREMENLQDMFIDPITERILEEMGEPIEFNGLLLRSCELLQTYHYPASQDIDYQRIRGNDRFAGFFYSDLINAIRGFKQKNSTGRAKVDMSPFQVWTTITRDCGVKQVEENNPIQAIKITQEAVTYVGKGGRGKESMNRESRAYLTSDLGITSEASVDSSDVGINVFLSANPGFSSLDGMGSKNRDITPTSMLSTSALLAPFAVNDDPKRMGFISIQQGHTIATDGYEPPMVRTGYESVIGMRTGEMFAKVAKEDGVVTSITDKGITVKYKSGKEQGYPLGMIFGKAEGSVYPHTLTTPLKVGSKFKKDEYLTFNTKFFTPDPVLPGGVVYKGSLMGRVALVELPETHEDSSTISEHLATRLRTTVTKVKTFTVGFKQNVLNVVKPGQKINPEDPLMIIEDEITSMDSSFSDESLRILSERSKNAPKAGYIGSIADVEVFYHGDTSDMSNTLKSLVTRTDKLKAEEAKSRLQHATTGKTDSDFTVDGTPLAVNKAVIRIYINVGDTASLGDKLVYGNQLKSVIGEVMPYTMRTESGDIVDVKMGAKSFANRIVRSLVMIGERASTLDAIGKTACKAYRG